MKYSLILLGVLLVIALVNVEGRPATGKNGGNKEEDSSRAVDDAQNEQDGIVGDGDVSSEERGETGRGKKGNNKNKEVKGRGKGKGYGKNGQTVDEEGEDGEERPNVPDGESPPPTDASTPPPRNGEGQVDDGNGDNTGDAPNEGTPRPPQGDGESTPPSEEQPEGNEEGVEPGPGPNTEDGAGGNEEGTEAGTEPNTEDNVNPPTQE